MAGFLFRAALSMVGLWIATRLISGIRIDDAQTLVLAGVVLGVVNAIVRPIAVILTLPLTLLTLGLFLLVVNGLMVLLVGWLLHQFHDYSYEIHGLLPAVFTTIVIWVVSLAGNMIIGGDERKRR